jgi:hypothetical protein
MYSSTYDEGYYGLGQEYEKWFFLNTIVLEYDYVIIEFFQYRTHVSSNYITINTVWIRVYTVQYSQSYSNDMRFIPVSYLLFNYFDIYEFY